MPALIKPVTWIFCLVVLGMPCASGVTHLGPFETNALELNVPTAGLDEQQHVDDECRMRLFGTFRSAPERMTRAAAETSFTSSSAGLEYNRVGGRFRENGIQWTPGPAWLLGAGGLIGSVLLCGRVRRLQFQYFIENS